MQLEVFISVKNKATLPVTSDHQSAIEKPITNDH